MGVVLFQHNQKAYEAVAALLDTEGKAAVIHPTGTGKSFIAFKLIEDHPQASFLWLSPSEYIFRSQLESLRRCDPDRLLANVDSMTYARLMQMSDAALGALEADYIILDEFHRCGATQWGSGVARLLKSRPEAKLLGLTATNIRYLDNQRDMAEELFQSCIASRMTLGEAVVRGILPPPKYVTAVYKWQQELSQYQKRVDAVRSAGVRSHNQAYLDTLRHALENADGLDGLFQRHITQKDGKYIVFCSGVEHMREIVAHVPQWFGAVDPAPHCYQAFSDNPESSQAFTDFNCDSSGHLKLLFCIDMLNEGIHVRGISGVILFRPTVSPIIYKQQVGRALTSGASETPLIIDIAANYENLCSVDAIQSEMEEAVQRLCRIGMEKQIHFRRLEITEQVKDCRVLFEKLERSLRSGWELCYQAARKYYQEHGHLEMHESYQSEEGIQLYNWLGTQRRIYNGKAMGRLTEDQIRRLEEIGMRWGSKDEYIWERNLKAARAYFREHGNLLVSASYTTQDGVRLGQWIHNLRQMRRKGTLSQEKICQLEEAGMVWDAAEARWELHYQVARRYYETHGHLNVPFTYKTDDGFALGTWLRRLRQVQSGEKAGTPLSEEQTRLLTEIGMQWGPSREAAWMRNYEEAKKYYETHGNLDIPRGYKIRDGCSLEGWLYTQRRLRKNAESGAKGTPLEQEKIRLLDGIGMVWEEKKRGRHPSAKY